jgi:hypothetical protein
MAHRREHAELVHELKWISCSCNKVPSMTASREVAMASSSKRGSFSGGSGIFVEDKTGLARA